MNHRVSRVLLESSCVLRPLSAAFFSAVTGE